ncbi:venom carboxylesterase-6-like isoform X2 [Spodoptera litura]|uniref:Carboxylic ester hydrolase n=1 Tax=Spodoptera litura TaxID=69820 RepID=A0A9J7EWM4_SPOLT|nr:venom carboxylesterase-6-like isoform X2 [Spodoptera litura]
MCRGLQWSVGGVRMLAAVVLVCGALAVAANHHHHVHHDLDHSTASTPAAPVVRSVSGQFRGSWMSSRRGRQFEAYRGVRYAQPPVGELRFQPPQLMENYTSEVDASQDGPACPQPTFNNYPVHEDCLRLNVYTPDHQSKKPLPVVVFMHAGGFYSVSGRSDVAGPQHLLDRDLVLVTINYRLGSLGFLSTGDKYAPGNNGFKDQVAALRWVQRNIAAFGGDPNLVTISGYSAGSFSVMLHMISPMSKGLFHRAISMSGSPISQIVIPRHQRHLAERQAKLLQCPTDSSKAIIDCLKTKTSKELGDSLDKMFDFGYDPVLLWVPIHEQDFGQEMFLPQQPLAAVCAGRLQRLPYIVSQTHDEFFWKALDVLRNPKAFDNWRADWPGLAKIALYLTGAGDNSSITAAANRLKQAYLGGKDINNDTATADGFGKLYSDAIIGFGAHRLVNLAARQSPRPVYYYEFGYIGNSSHYVDPDTKRPIAAAHHDDLLYLFNVSYSFPSIPPSDSKDSKMVDKMTAIFYNFARHGDPNDRGDTPELADMSWPQFKPDERKYLRVDTPFSVRSNLFEERFKVWEELFPLDYQTCK